MIKKNKAIFLFAILWSLFVTKGMGQTNTFSGDQDNLSYKDLFGNNDEYQDVILNGNLTITSDGNVSSYKITKGKSLTVTGNLIIEEGSSTELKIGTDGNSTVTIGGGFQSPKSVYVYNNSRLTIGSETNEYTSEITMGSNLKIYGTSIVEIWGDVNTGSQFYVEEGATLIIHGDLTMTGSSNNDFLGTVIVTGDVDMVKCTITTTGNFVVGGNFSMDEVESISGEIYSIGGGSVTVGKDVNSETDYGEDKDLSDLEELAKTDESASELLEKLKDYGVISDEGETVDRLWTGNGKSSLWTDKYNWSPNKVPDEESTVQIAKDKSYYPIISAMVEVNDLVIENDAKLTISAGSYVTIKGDLTTNMGLIINNTQDKISSVIVKGESKGEVTEKWDLEYDRWWYISLPVSGDLIDDYKSSLGSDNYYLYVYDNASFSWTKITGYDSYDFSAKQAIALGILNSGHILSYSGAMNNEESYIYTAAQSGYQNIGNPYPSYVDFNAICTSTNSTITQSEEDDYSGYTGYTSYIYTTYEGVRQYATYNTKAGYGLCGGSRYISPGQCFWVYAAAGEKVEITKEACTNSPKGSVSLKSADSSDNNEIIKLALSNANTDDELLIIGDSENGSDEITKYDSKKRSNSGVIGNIYSIKENTNIAINSLPEFYDGQIIPLGYSVSSAGMTDFTVKVLSLTNVDDYDVYLCDLALGDSINLKTTTTYTFTPNEASANDRFHIKIASTETVSNEDDKTTGIIDTESSDVFVYSSGNTAYVNVPESLLQSSNRMIYVYDVAGQLIQQEEFDDLHTSFDLPSTGVYIIKVVSGDKSYQQKILIK